MIITMIQKLKARYIGFEMKTNQCIIIEFGSFLMKKKSFVI